MTERGLHTAHTLPSYKLLTLLYLLCWLLLVPHKVGIEDPPVT